MIQITSITDVNGLPSFLVCSFALSPSQLTLTLVRHTFLAELRNCSGRMAMLEGELGGLCSEYSAIKGTVDQRLKWAQDQL